MRARVLGPTTIFVFIAASFAGCLDTPMTDPGASEAPSVVGTKERLLSFLETVPEPIYDGAKGANWWENFVTTYGYRHWGTPANLASAEFIESELADAGFEANTFSYQRGVRGTPVPVGDYLVVHGLKMGKTNPDHRLALISHFDTVPNTPQGAYDDGSGVAAEMEICKLLAKVETNKTIECIFFDGEEQGLVASAAYAADYAAGGKDWVWDQAFGYDMTGLNWPGFNTWKLYAMVGTQHDDLLEYTEPHQAFMNTTLYDFLGAKLGIKPEGVETLQVHDRNSDEQNFKRIGIPVIRFAGGRKAADYPMYHQPGDVTQFVYAYACTCQDLARGKEAFTKGFEMVVLTSYYTILAWDQFDPKQINDIS